MFKQVLGAVSAFIRPRLLSAQAFGIWSLLALIPLYASYLHFGTRSSLRLRLAEKDNKGENAAVMRGTTRISSLVPNLVLALGLLTAAIYPLENTQLRISLALSAVIVLFNWWFGLQLVMLKAEQDFRIISRANYLRALLLFLFTITFLPLWGLSGAVLAALLSLGFTCLYLAYYQKGREYSPFQWRYYLDLIREGFPLLGIDMMVLLARSSDRLVIASLLGIKVVGYYAIGGMIVGFLINVPGAAREATEPKLMQEFEQLDYPRFIERYFSTPIFNTAMLYPLVIGPAWLIMPLFLHVVLPDYTASLTPARILFLGSYFLTLYFPLRGLMFAHGWQHKSFATAAGILLLNLFGSILTIKIGLGLPGVAVVSAAAFFSLFAVEGTLTVRRIRRKIELRMGRRFFWASLAFPLNIFCLFMLEYWFSLETYGLYVATSLKILLFLAGWLVILRLSWWPYRISSKEVLQ